MMIYQTRATRLTFAAIGLLLLTTACWAATLVRSQETRSADQWVKENLPDSGQRCPFSFSYDGRLSGELLPSWSKDAQTKKLDKVRTQRTITWTDPKTRLKVRCVAVHYTDFPAVEWTVYLKNIGKRNTPILESIQGLDIKFQRQAEGEFILNGVKGDFCTADSYEPFRITLGPSFTRKFSPFPHSGKSSDGPDGWPYWNLQIPGGGVILACGWPGQWESSFTRDSDKGLRVVAGQQLTHLCLKPGEEIRTPLIAMLFWQGTDVVKSQNVWRRWYMAHVVPKVNGKPQPPITQIQVDGSVETRDVDAYIQAGIKPDICWRDAGGGYTWYPSEGGPFKDGNVWLNTGTWEIDPAKYPNGFRPFSDKVHALGMQFLLWFEPERVGDPNSWLAKNHPEWLLRSPGQSACGDILDEGNPEALKWLIDHVDGMIKSQRLDWYREDMNGDGPLPAWRKHDAEDRQGITENFYVQGHLAFWDGIVSRNPGLRLDSCASGGRRNDLETMRRSVPLLRSDYQFPSQGNIIDGNQGHTWGISSWLPWYGSGVYGIDTYGVRSFLMPGFGVVPPSNWEKTDATRAAVKKAYDEVKRVAPLMLGDYYPLTPYSLDPDKWIAWQFDRPEEGDGVVQAFRRSQAPDETINLKLQGLDADARYELTDLDSTAVQYSTGAELMQKGLGVTAKSRPSAVVVIYKKQ